jgi:hypothetical protein
VTLRHWLAVLTIAIVLTLQIGIPTLQFFEEGVNRWGWQMYSRMPIRPTLTAVHPDGNREPIRLSDHVYYMRSEIRVDNQQAVEQFCERVDGAEAIELFNEQRDEVTVYPCSR